jgi:sucrose-6-phosphate hydrolase SacC (GH32 family)
MGRSCLAVLTVVAALCGAGVLAQRVTSYGEPLRPQVHFTPPSNFMNDPNGLVYFEGEYHLFYQHNPLGSRWGHMSWGHAVSKDLLRWTHLPVALREEDGVMIFSGSAVVDRSDSSGLCGGRPCLVAIYTGHTSTRQTQNLAYSRDRGRTWTKYSGNPVLDLQLKDFRDPKVFWHAPTSRWIMVTVLPDRHKVRLFGSRDLRKWDQLSDFGPAGATGGIWECPDLFPLPIEGEPGESRWVLDVDLNPGAIAGGSGGQYFVGRFDGTTFVAEHDTADPLWSDYGADFYATITFSDLPPADGRRIWMGWMSNWLYANDEPTSPWRGALSIPRALTLRRTPDGLRLVQRPVREFDTLRSRSSVRVGSQTLLPAAAEFRLAVRPGEAPAGLRLSNADNEWVEIGVGGSPVQLFVDRRRSRGTQFHDAYPGRHAAPVRLNEGLVDLHVIVDASTVEVFANGGETVISDRVFPTRPFTLVGTINAAQVPGAATMWALESVWR